MSLKAVGKRSPAFVAHLQEKNQEKAIHRFNCLEGLDLLGPLVKKGGMRMWKRAKIKEFLSKADQLMQLLLVLMHLTSGAPPRSSELLGITLCNQVQFI